MEASSAADRPTTPARARTWHLNLLHRLVLSADSRRSSRLTASRSRLCQGHRWCMEPRPAAEELPMCGGSRRQHCDLIGGGPCARSVEDQPASSRLHSYAGAANGPRIITLSYYRQEAVSVFAIKLQASDRYCQTCGSTQAVPSSLWCGPRFLPRGPGARSAVAQNSYSDASLPPSSRTAVPHRRPWRWS